MKTVKNITKAIYIFTVCWKEKDSIFFFSQLRGGNKLGLAYTNVKEACRATPCPNLGSSDHQSVLLISAHKAPLDQGEKEVRVWPAGRAWAGTCLKQRLQTIIKCRWGSKLSLCLWTSRKWILGNVERIEPGF